ncbi:hypothetical protein Q1J52_22920 [Pseudomonas lijiangensis]|uniref:Uncharacterized protein n=1 Tax=Pseudomonas cichorii TaxID=36746 RepID=A0ABQ1DN30_PSECI|nr:MULTISPECIES: hypothetical protein [Pseudomonas]GFM76335.1 hypothetical protein PSCICM_21540 [Pseudomonas cichorii]GFM92430.1 hypothetical protein PSCICP_24020 [Pseudomonas cichorii]
MKCIQVSPLIPEAFESFLKRRTQLSGSAPRLVAGIVWTTGAGATGVSGKQTAKQAIELHDRHSMGGNAPMVEPPALAGCLIVSMAAIAGIIPRH